MALHGHAKLQCLHSTRLTEHAIERLQLCSTGKVKLSVKGAGQLFGQLNAVRLQLNQALEFLAASGDAAK